MSDVADHPFWTVVTVLFIIGLICEFLLECLPQRPTHDKHTDGHALAAGLNAHAHAHAVFDAGAAFKVAA